MFGLFYVFFIHLAFLLSLFKDLILSVLNARPSVRDSKTYLASFRKSPQNNNLDINHSFPLKDSTTSTSTLDPINPRTGLVKLQGPFTDRQLSSIGFGMNHLHDLGLVSVIVVDS